MARWSDIAHWEGPTPNRTSGGMQEFRGLVLHIMQGSYAGSISWGKNPASSVSFHFATRGDGHLGQLVDTADTAWTQGSGNGHWISVENEGFSGNPLTDGQVEACAQLYARGVREYGWPLQSTDSPNGYGLGWHGMGGAAWGGHPDCPGEPIKDQRPAILARAAEILGGDDMAFGDQQMQQLNIIYHALTQGVLAGAMTVDGRPYLDEKTPMKTNEALREILAKLADPVPVEVDAAAVAAALVKDPAFIAALEKAAFEGAQRAERE